jgi:hypothetical protein
MYTCYPFLFHFHDESGEDCWAVRDMAQQYLTQAKAYISSNSTILFHDSSDHQIEESPDRYLRRNASNADEEDGGALKVSTFLGRAHSAHLCALGCPAGAGA